MIMKKKNDWSENPSQEQGSGCWRVSPLPRYERLLSPGYIAVLPLARRCTGIHLNNPKHTYMPNIYIPHRDTTSQDYHTEDKDITNTFTHLIQLKNNRVTGDIILIAHWKSWHSLYTEERGDPIADINQNTNHITLNTNITTKLPVGPHQQLSAWHNRNKVHYSDSLPGPPKHIYTQPTCL